MRVCLAGVCFCLALLASGCGNTDSRNLHPEAPSPQGRATDVSVVISGNTEFAIDLYQQLRDREGNLFLSPHGLSTALAMAYAGAHGETAEQMAETLHFNLTGDDLHEAFGSLAGKLARRSEPDYSVYGAGFELRVANSVWVQQGLALRPEYAGLLSQRYGSETHTVDFRGRPEAARAAINDWVEENTRGRVPDVVPRGLITPSEVLAIANAIYFEAPWLHKFKPEATRRGSFNLLDGGSVRVPMMSHSAPFRYASTHGCRAVELPYDGEEIAMVILLPERGGFSEFEKSLSTETLGAIWAAMDDTEGRSPYVDLTMPRFRLSSSFILNDDLSAMGMPNAFSPPMADFSGIGLGAIYISFVVHKADIKVDEEGTVAAAGTVIGFRGGSSQVLDLTIDRPFIFLIRDLKTGTILFLGRVLDPSAD